MPRPPPDDERALVPLFERRLNGKPERVYIHDLADHLFVSAIRIRQLAATRGRLHGEVNDGMGWVTVETAARIIIAQRAADGHEVAQEGRGSGPHGGKLCPFVRRARIRAKFKRINARRPNRPR